MTGKDGSILTVHEWMDEFMLLRLMRELWEKRRQSVTKPPAFVTVRAEDSTI